MPFSGIGPDTFEISQRIAHLQQQLDRAVREKDRYRFEVARLREHETVNRKLEQRLSLLESLDNLVTVPPKWTQTPNKKGGLYTGTPVLFTSDVHCDEVVKPERIEGINEYNREIAERRLKRIQTTVIDEHRRRFSEYRDGFLLALGGDIFSGNIHEELKQSNEDTIMGSLDYWLDRFIAYIGGFLEEFGHMHVVCVVGNHGRNTFKPVAKFHVRDNFDWLFYRQLARYFDKDSRITFQIPESTDADFRIHNHNYRLTHGDQFRGGAGIAGPMTPLMLGQRRKAIRQMLLGKPFDTMLVAHWHFLWWIEGMIVNGSVKGYCEYAYKENFQPDRAQQAFWINTPENGPTYTMKIFGEPWAFLTDRISSRKIIA